MQPGSVVAAPVWTYWISFWLLGVDVIALVMLGVGYVIKVLRPGIELRRDQEEQARSKVPQHRAEAFLAPRTGRPPLQAATPVRQELGPPPPPDVMSAPARRKESVRRADS
ncbi:MAG TPA: hypothetical protein VHT30_09540 [Acidimicrobiales bacterium]|jgi:hypothetical protein|nr:hypothetical protein [Acidimicrobiales bacterium]